MAEQRIRLGMVGGGEGAFIGAVHRIAARLDDRFELVAAALSSDPARSKAAAADLHIASDRAYGSFSDMAQGESARPDRIDAVAIVTVARRVVPAVEGGLLSKQVDRRPQQQALERLSGTLRSAGFEKRIIIGRGPPPK